MLKIKIIFSSTLVFIDYENNENIIYVVNVNLFD